MTLQSTDHGTRYSSIEWRARLDLAACYRLADMFGFSDIVWNHITAKLPGTENFLINRFGLRYDEVTASNLVTVDLDGKLIDAGTAESDEDVNLTGFVIHSAIHAARPDVHCVMHTHSEGGMAVAALKEGLLPLQIDGLPFHKRVAYHDFEGLSVEMDERQRLAADLGERNAMILRNHGLLTCGETVGAAFMEMYYLERACKLQMQVLASGRPIELPSEELCERTAKQAEAFAHGKYEWPALLRLVEKKAPDFST